jgi:outer membrane autotransporter protein
MLLVNSFGELQGLIKRHAGRIPAEGCAGRGMPTVLDAGGALDTLAGGWGQIEGGRFKAESDNGVDYSSDRWSVKAGYDANVDLASPDRMIVGAYAMYGGANDSAGSRLGSASMDSEGFGGGVSLPYYAESGAYADLQGRLMRVDSDLDAKSGVTSTVAAGSIEVGHVFDIGQGASLIPSAQLRYGEANASSFVDDRNNVVSDFNDDALTGRLGIAVQSPIMAAAILTASLDYIHEFSPETRVTVGPGEAATELPHDWLEVGLGLDWQVGVASVLGLHRPMPSLPARTSPITPASTRSSTTGWRSRA